MTDLVLTAQNNNVTVTSAYDNIFGAENGGSTIDVQFAQNDMDIVLRGNGANYAKVLQNSTHELTIYAEGTGVSTLIYGKHVGNAGSELSYEAKMAWLGAGNDKAFTGLVNGYYADMGEGFDTVEIYANANGLKAEIWAGNVMKISGAFGDLQLDNSEMVKFSDGVLVNHNAASANVEKMYSAAFGREADGGGIAFWIEQNKSVDQMAHDFSQSAEFKAMYANTSNEQYVDKLYQNVLGRDGEAAGEAYWKGALDNGASREKVLAQFALSAENDAHSAHAGDVVFYNNDIKVVGSALDLHVYA